MTENAKEDLKCDILILITTSSEQDALQAAAKKANISFERKKLDDLGEYYYLGVIGTTRVNAARTKMGSLGHGGSAAKAINFKIASGATAIIQLGMAFGIDQKLQNVGDVLVSTSIIPYDNRMVVPAGLALEVMPSDVEGLDADSESTATVDESAAKPGYVKPFVRSNSKDSGSKSSLLGRLLDVFRTWSCANLWRYSQQNPQSTGLPGSLGYPPAYQTDYSRAQRHYAKQSLLEILKREATRGGYGHQILFGGMLSGGAIIRSNQYLKELVNSVPQAEDGIIGGDMEGVGLLSVSHPDEPLWVVVKGISDFADDCRATIGSDKSGKALFNDQRRTACQNSARFVLQALANAESK